MSSLKRKRVDGGEYTEEGWEPNDIATWMDPEEVVASGNVELITHQQCCKCNKSLGQDKSFDLVNKPSVVKDKIEYNFFADHNTHGEDYMVYVREPKKQFFCHKCSPLVYCYHCCATDVARIDSVCTKCYSESYKCLGCKTKRCFVDSPICSSSTYSKTSFESDTSHTGMCSACWIKREFVLVSDSKPTLDNSGQNVRVFVQWLLSQCKIKKIPFFIHPSDDISNIYYHLVIGSTKYNEERLIEINWKELTMIDIKQINSLLKPFHCLLTYDSILLKQISFTQQQQPNPQPTTKQEPQQISKQTLGSPQQLITTKQTVAPPTTTTDQDLILNVFKDGLVMAKQRWMSLCSCLRYKNQIYRFKTDAWGKQVILPKSGERFVLMDIDPKNKHFQIVGMYAEGPRKGHTCNLAVNSSYLSEFLLK